MSYLIRTLQQGNVGKDVEACKRAVYRFLNDGADWDRFVHSIPLVRRTFGPFFKLAVKRAQAKLGLQQTGAIGPRTFEGLMTAGAFDALAEDLLDEYVDEQRIRLCYPHPAGAHLSYGPLHPTSGIVGNWARDFLAPGGTAVVASYDSAVQRFSGHDPATGLHGAARDVFGWSVYLIDPIGRIGFLTHLGTRTVYVGQRLRAGQKLGTVGHWPRDPGRSHTHEGISSPNGTVDAKDRITDIALAKKIPAL